MKYRKYFLKKLKQLYIHEYKVKNGRFDHVNCFNLHSLWFKEVHSFQQNSRKDFKRVSIISKKF